MKTSIALILFVAGFAAIALIANTVSFSLENTNNIMLGFFDPIFNFMEDLFFGILDFFGKLFFGG